MKNFNRKVAPSPKFLIDSEGDGPQCLDSLKEN